MIKTKVLLVEDDKNFGNILKDFLSLNEYEVTLARDGEEGFKKFQSGSYDIALLDVMMPIKDGFTLASEIREVNQTIPLVFLTAKSLKEDILNGFKIGADDYLTKPFEPEVLIAKIKAILARKKMLNQEQTSEEKEMYVGDFKLDTSLKLLYYKDETGTKLSPKESQLLTLLIIHKNNLMPRDVALKQIWRESNFFTSRSMDVYIAKLRKYLKRDSSVEIKNIHGSGFQLIHTELVS